MDAPNISETPEVLRSAWKRYAELDATANKLTKQHKNMRLSIAIIGVIATFLAVTIEQLDIGANTEIARDVLGYILILLPISISLISAYINKFLGNGEWLTLRAAAEELLKEIYLYRTILQGHSERAHWLSHRMITIMRRVYKSMSGQLVLEKHNGQLPPYYSADDPDSDPGFTDLDCDEYLKYRLINQRNWHRDRIAQRQRERKRIQVTILAMGALGSLFAALANSWIAWVAVTAAIASALTGWEQLRGLDETIMIYSRVNMELTIVRDEWESIPRENRNRENYTRLIRESEEIMWAQNQKYVSTMQDVLAAADGDDAHLVESMITTGKDPMAIVQARDAAAAARQMQEAEYEGASQLGHTEVDPLIAEGHDHEFADMEVFDTAADSYDQHDEEIMGEAEVMRDMMASAVLDHTSDTSDDVFPDEVIDEMEETLVSEINEDGDVQQAIEEVFKDGENGMIEEALSGFVNEDEEEDIEVKG